MQVVKYSPDSSKLAIGGDTGNRDAKTGKLLKTLDHDKLV